MLAEPRYDPQDEATIVRIPHCWQGPSKRGPRPAPRSRGSHRYLVSTACGRSCDSLGVTLRYRNEKRRRLRYDPQDEALTVGIPQAGAGIMLPQTGNSRSRGSHRYLVSTACGAAISCVTSSASFQPKNQAVAVPAWCESAMLTRNRGYRIPPVMRILFQHSIRTDVRLSVGRYREAKRVVGQQFLDG